MSENPSCPSSLPNSNSSFNRIEAIVQSSDLLASSLTPKSFRLLFTASHKSGTPHVCVLGLVFCILGVKVGIKVATGIGKTVGEGVPVSGGFKRSEERRVGKECRSRWSP